jgi:hypothetical protein
MVMKVELLEDYKEYGKCYVHVHDSQDQWALAYVNRKSEMGYQLNPCACA